MQLGPLITITLVAFIYTLAYLAKKRGRHPGNFELEIQGCIILLKTTRLNETISRLGRKHAKLLKVLGDLGIAASIVTAGYGIYFFHENLLLWVSSSSAASPVSPILPGITIGLDEAPYFLLAIAVTLIPHELAHALQAASEQVKVRSTGIFLAVLLPGGFADVDENELASKNLRSKLRVLAAGSFANILTFLALATLFFVVLASPLAPRPAGVLISGTIPGYPAHGALAPGDIVVAVNCTTTPTLDEFSRALSNFKPGEAVKLTIIRDGKKLNFTLTLATNPQNSTRGFLGVRISQAYTNEWLLKAFQWLIVVTSSVAIINVLPILPMDGGKMLSYALEKALPKRFAKGLSLGLSIYLASLLILNIAFSYSFWLPFKP
jgi:membrane-associated protease RseP (regulator of RpoE activity)